MTEHQSPQMRIAELNRRLLAGEDLPVEEIKEGIQLLRSDRAAKTEVKKKKAEDKQKVAQKGDDILGSL